MDLYFIHIGNLVCFPYIILNFTVVKDIFHNCEVIKKCRVSN